MALRNLLLPSLLLAFLVFNPMITSATRAAKAYPELNFFINMRNETAPLFLACMAGHHVILQNGYHSGDVLMVKIKLKGNYECSARWGMFMAAFLAFDVERDAAHCSVQWEIKDGGLYLSWDNQSQIAMEVLWTPASH